MTDSDNTVQPTVDASDVVDEGRVWNYFCLIPYSICSKKINLKKSHTKLRILMRQTIKYARAIFQDHSFGLQVATRFKHCLKNTKILFQGPVKSPQDPTTKKNIGLESYTEK